MFYYDLGSQNRIRLGLEPSLLAREKEYLISIEKETERERERERERESTILSLERRFVGASSDLAALLLGKPDTVNLHLNLRGSPPASTAEGRKRRRRAG